MNYNSDNWMGDVESPAYVGVTTKVWHQAAIRRGATVGENCIIGRGAYIDAGVVIGDNCKIQNNALIYGPAVLGHGVFIGPNVVLTNDHFPRAINPDGTRKNLSDWKAAGVQIKNGASIGAHCVCIAPVVIGEWALVGGGSVVTVDVLNFSIVVGNPARHIGWVGRSGEPLVENRDGTFSCPKTKDVYKIDSRGQLFEMR